MCPLLLQIMIKNVVISIYLILIVNFIPQILFKSDQIMFIEANTQHYCPTIVHPKTPKIIAYSKVINEDWDCQLCLKSSTNIKIVV